MSKIKINQEEYASTMFQMFLSLHRYAAKRWPRWLFFTAFILWHIFLEYPELYRQFCLQSLGRVVQHQPYTAHSSPQEQQQQLYAAWQYSCRLHGLNPQHATHLPRLFAIDQLLQWPQGQTFVLEQIQQDYVQYLKSQSSSSSCSSGCSSCGGD